MAHAHTVLILFSRFPRPGFTKTRLIPALGAAGAAAMQRRMTEQVLAQAEAFCHRHDIALEIHVQGGAPEAMRQWLGPHRFVAQSGADLGARMAASFRAAFAAGAQQAVIIGTDCPGLSSDILGQAFRALADHDLVVGPAMDGGYYLLGLTAPRPELFTDIAWGSPTVLGQTLAKAQTLTVHQLVALHDIDRPEDLVHLDYHPDPQ